MAKILISLNEELLRKIDRMAKSAGLSRSAYIARLAQRDAASGSAASVRSVALEHLDRLFARAPSVDFTAEVRADRDTR